MSRVAQLPPRIPVRNTAPSNHIANPSSQKGGKPLLQHQKSPSQSSSFYEHHHHSWAGDHLDEHGTFTNLPPLRRTVSEPVAILEENLSFDFSQFKLDEESSFTNNGSYEAKSCGYHNDVYGGLESNDLYGPNSPRRMENLTHSESTVVSAIFESVNNNAFGYVSANCPSKFDVNELNGNGVNFPCVTFEQGRPSKRHTGQRSRVRKLQYIAELEKTVNLFQTLEADLAAKVASLFQQRAGLSIENSKLKQKITSLRKEKMMKDGQCQSLKNELKKLNTRYPELCKSRSMASAWLPQEKIGKDSSRILDMGMLNLQEKQPSIPLRHGFKSHDSI